MHILLVSCTMGCARALRLAFQPPPILAILGIRGAEPPAVAVTTVWHARSISHAIFYAHAACHAARAHIERERDRPCPEPSLAAACSAAQAGTGISKVSQFRKSKLRSQFCRNFVAIATAPRRFAVMGPVAIFWKTRPGVGRRGLVMAKLFIQKGLRVPQPFL